MSYVSNNLVGDGAELIQTYFNDSKEEKKD